MIKNYVISRYSGTKREVKFNVRVARYMAKMIVREGGLPVVPHIYFTQFMNDKNKYARARGTAIALELLKKCDCATIIVVDGIISEGMEKEIALAEELGIETVRFDFPKALIKKMLRESGV